VGSAVSQIDFLYRAWMRSVEQALRTGARLDRIRADAAAQEYFDELVITDLVGPGHLPVSV
jgi:hypothetical protein